MEENQNTQSPLEVKKKTWVTPKIELISRNIVQSGTWSGVAEGVVYTHTFSGGSTHTHLGAGS